MKNKESIVTNKNQQTNKILSQQLNFLKKMKKKISILAAAMALLISITSCNKENTGGDPIGEGSLKISFKFATVPNSKAAVSTAQPETSWANLENGTLQLALVQNGVVKYTRPITAFPTSGTASYNPPIFDRIPKGSYDVYLIGNNNKVSNLLGSSTAQIGAATTIQVGTNISSVLFSMINAQPSAVLGTPPAGAAYDEASELFIGYVSAVIETDDTTPATIDLKRAVSLLRIRINQTDVTSEANIIDFKNNGNTNTSIRLRRHAGALSITTPAIDPFSMPQFSGKREDDAFVSTKTFKTTSTPAGYTGDMGVSVADFSLWNDYVILPGGHATIGAQKFNLLLSGHAPDGYEGVNFNPRDNTGKSNGIGDTARVWWQADVDNLIATNGILVLNVTVATKGYVDPNPPTLDTYGKLDISVSLAPWGLTTNVPVEM